MKRIFTLILTVLAVIVLVLVSQVSAFALSKRLWGQTSEGTAAAISQNDWNTSTYVLVTRSDYFTDALAGVSLAYKFFDHSSQKEDAPAPILLTERTRLSPETKAEIERLQAKIVIILGGPGAIPPEVENELRKIPGVGEVQRIWAENSAGTARDIFERMRIYSDFIGSPRPDTAVIATLVNFQDALAASSPAAANNMPILLTEPDSVPAETLQALSDGQIKKIIIVGGEAVVSKSVENDLKNRGYSVIARLWGQTEYDTAIAVANANQHFNFDYTTAYIARGDWFTDALAGGASASWMLYEDSQNLLTAPAPIILVKTDGLPEATKLWLTANKSIIEDVFILGGVGAISNSVEASINGIVF